MKQTMEQCQQLEPQTPQEQQIENVSATQTTARKQLDSDPTPVWWLHVIHFGFFLFFYTTIMEISLNLVWNLSHEVGQHTHFPSTASTTLTSISSSFRENSIRSLRSGRRRRLIRYI